MENPITDKNFGIVNYFRPVNLVLGLLSFILGLAMASFLKIKINWTAVVLGYGLLVSSELVVGVIAWGRGKSLQQEPKGVSKSLSLAMAISAVLLMLIATLFVALLIQTNYNISIILLTIIILTLTLVRSFNIFEGKLLAYREIFESIKLAGLFPAFSFVINAGEFHRILVLLGMPLVFLFLGALIALTYPQYASDLSGKKDTLLIKLGWQQGIFLHDFSLLGGMILVGISGLLGLAWQLLWPNLLLLPIIISEIWILHRMAEGARRNWRLLKVNSYAILFLSVYIMIFSLLIN